MKKYEAVFILDIRKVEDEGDGFTREFGALIGTLGGKMDEAKPMGRIQFSYEIKKRKAGIYWNYLFELDQDKVLELKDKFRLDERVLRNQIVIYDRPAEARTLGRQNAAPAGPAAE